MSMLKVAIVGSTGYTGVELLRILIKHPEIEIVALTSERFAGQKISDIFPSLESHLGLKCQKLDVKEISKMADLVFLALPHTMSMTAAPYFIESGVKVVDLSADYRLKESQIYQKWYKKEHTSKNLLESSVYGLPELYREQIKEADLIANPGCYPTSIILALAPLLKKEIVELGDIIIDSKSGISGAGRKTALDFHFPECNENIKAYGLGTHRHIPEIEQELSELAQGKVIISFVPHLIPTTRGILSTIYAKLCERINSKELIDIYKDFYKDDCFVKICDEGKMPNTKDVLTTNYCSLGLAVNEKANRVIVVSAIDNLVKGASGQAVQNMNIMCGFEEAMGLDYPAVFP